MATASWPPSGRRAATAPSSSSSSRTTESFTPRPSVAIPRAALKRLLVIFDFDGTLADSWAVAVDELRATAARFGLRQLSLAEIEELRGQPTRRVFDALGVPLWRVPEIAAHVSRRFEERAQDIRLFPGAPEMLAALDEAGAVLGVVSSNSQDTIRAVMGPANMRYVARVECGAALFGKSRRFLRVMRDLGAAKEHTVAVGDESRDLDAAAKAGIVGLGVEWGYASPSVLREMAPGRTFPTVAALTAHLVDRA